MLSVWYILTYWYSAAYVFNCFLLLFVPYNEMIVLLLILVWFYIHTHMSRSFRWTGACCWFNLSSLVVEKLVPEMTYSLFIIQWRCHSISSHLVYCVYGVIVPRCSTLFQFLVRNCLQKYRRLQIQVVYVDFSGIFFILQFYYVTYCWCFGIFLA